MFIQWDCCKSHINIEMVDDEGSQCINLAKTEL